MTSATQNPFADLTPAEASLVRACINQFGDACHPLADRETLPGFAPGYACTCVKRAIRSRQLSGAGLKIARNVLASLSK